MKNETINTELTKEQQFILLDYLHNEMTHITDSKKMYNSNKERFADLKNIVDQIQKTWRK